LRQGWALLDRRTALAAAAIVAIVSLSATLAVIQPGASKVDSPATSSSAHPQAPAISKYPTGKSFIRIRALDSNSVWSLDAVNAQQVLGNVTGLKPDVLERFVSGPQRVDAQVPVAAGTPPMTVGEFLNASTKACACYIIPRLSLSDYGKGTLFTEAQGLLTFPVSPQMRYLSLDNWGPFASGHTSDEVKGMFRQLYSQGWLGIGVNECDGYSQSYGYATFADFCVGTSYWRPDRNALASIHTEPNIKLVLLYIDFPQQMTDFSALQPDREAEILAHRIAPAQSADGFVFVYPMQQDSWNSATRLTSVGGPFKGQSLYDVMKGLMARYDTGALLPASVVPSSNRPAGGFIGSRSNSTSGLVPVGGGDSD
jgi:hypothetical protein